MSDANKNIIKMFILLITLCAIITSAGVKILQENTGSLEMKKFNIQNNEFRSLDFSKEAADKLRSISKKTGVKYEKLFTVMMLKSRYHIKEAPLKSEIMCDLSGYEKRDEKKLEEIVSYYRRMLQNISYFPFADIYEDDCDKWIFLMNYKNINTKKLFSGEKALYTMSAADVKHDFAINIYVKNNEVSSFVVAINDGVIVDSNYNDKNDYINIETKDGNCIRYKNILMSIKKFNTGDVVKAGELIGELKNPEEGLQLTFWLKDKNGRYISFCAKTLFKENNFKIRKVKQRLISKSL